MAHTLNYYASLDDFLALLGNPEPDVEVSLDEVADRLPRVLRVVVPVTSQIPQAVFGADFDWDRYRYYSELKEALPTQVLATRRYTQEHDTITVVNARWQLVVDCFQFDREDIGPYVGYEDVRLTGPIQFYLPEDDELLPQVISARLVADDLPQPVHGIGG